MKPIQDNFSNQASNYAKYRPHYPAELYEIIYSHCTNFDTAWDCGTGNGQAAIQLAQQFKQVIATDISESQLENAQKAENIIYQKERAEKTSFKDNTFDCITVGQALHWFDFEVFYPEVKRVAKANAIFAAWTYMMPRVSPELNLIIDEFHFEFLGKYWDKERKYVDAGYKNMPFDFKKVMDYELVIRQTLSFDAFIGYMGSSSAIQHYIKEHQENPIKLFEDKISKYWKEGEQKEIIQPLFLKIADIEK